MHHLHPALNYFNISVQNDFHKWRIQWNNIEKKKKIKEKNHFAKIYVQTKKKMKKRDITSHYILFSNIINHLALWIYHTNKSLKINQNVYSEAANAYNP